jgi:hypothetical protein
MAEEFLHRPDVLPGFQKMGCKAMAQRVWGNTSRDFVSAQVSPAFSLFLTVEKL